MCCRSTTGRRATRCSRTRRGGASVQCSVRGGKAPTAPSRHRERALAGPLRGHRVSVAPGRTAVAAGPRPTILSWRRLLICLGGGLLAAGLAVVARGPEIAVLVGWAVTPRRPPLWGWWVSWAR